MVILFMSIIDALTLQWESCKVWTGRELGAGWRRGSQKTRRRRDRSCCSGVGKLGRKIRGRPLGWKIEREHGLECEGIFSEL